MMYAYSAQQMPFSSFLLRWASHQERPGSGKVFFSFFPWGACSAGTRHAKSNEMDVAGKKRHCFWAVAA